MLTLNFIPQSREDKQQQQVMSWNDPVLTIDSEDFDLSLVPDGGTARTNGVLLSVERNSNDYVVEVFLFFGLVNPPEETRFPEQQLITENGPIYVPPFDILPDPEPEPEPEEMDI